MTRRLVCSTILCGLWVSGLFEIRPTYGGWVESAVHARQQPEQQTEFLPIDQLPPQDQLPAAPLLVAAYSVVLLALFAYLVSVARRLVGVQRELERLEADLKRRK
jgi:CcmD family protein